MRYFQKIFFLFLSVCFFVFSAQAINYHAIDKMAKNMREYSTEKALVDNLTKRLKTEEEKARAIYAWIVSHIDYDYYKFNAYKEDRKLKQKSDIFKSRTGICGDIAKLYQKMAKLAGLECEYISGYAGKNVTRKTLNDSLHAWNAVKIKGKWYLVDATWGINGGDTFGKDIRNDNHYRLELNKRERQKDTNRMKKRDVDDRYFMADPKWLINTHFPKDKKWQLIQPTKSLNKFLKR